MSITNDEKIIANQLIEKFLQYKSELPYANISMQNEYLGWVDNFNLKYTADKSISLDLKQNNDLFLLFVLAVVWSRTGQWENSAFFVSYLKVTYKDNPLFWTIDNNVNDELNNRDKSAEFISSKLKGHKPRKKISFRSDIFSSIKILANNWNEIVQKLNESEDKDDFELFMDFIRNISGLGVGNKKILIKIPLILRELRCQGIYQKIDGKLCCVPDARVYDAAKSLNINIPKTSNLNNLKESSSIIYELFGDLYDLPLFAYEDLKDK